MSEISAETLAQRITDSGLLDARQMEMVWSELGTRDVTFEQLTSLLTRRELITNFQLDRLVKGEKGGYFYGNFKVLYLAGSGTFARVYRAVEKGTNRIVAIKVLRKRFRDNKENREEFIREGEIGSHLRHPNIVPILEVNKNPAAPYIVMEFVEGQNLRAFVRARKKLTPAEGIRLTIDILQGLVYAAERGMSHRDLKLSNVLMTSRGRGKLVDFGLASLQASGGASADDIAAARTMDYAGLEKASGCRPNDPRSDLYFVGAMLYNMVTGVPALLETRDRVQRQSAARYSSIKPVLEVDPTVPRSLATFIMRSLELSPDRRYASAIEMLEDAKRIQTRLEQGDDASDAEASKNRADAAEADRKLPGGQEGQNRTVMVVESKLELQDLFREKLKKHGYRVLIISDPERAIKRFREGDGKAADCVIFCTTDLGATALDAFNTLGTLPETKKLPAILFVDAKHATAIRGANLAPHRVMLVSPLKLKELRETLLKLLFPETYAPAQ
ncbi:MAG: protein kinase domain-containing protein [Planctomycetaceae bacterium]